MVPFRKSGHKSPVISSIFSLRQLEGITSLRCLHHMITLPSSFYGERCYGIHL